MISTKLNFYNYTEIGSTLSQMLGFSYWIPKIMKAIAADSSLDLLLTNVCDE